jgi:short-subunit dehydrogenase
VHTVLVTGAGSGIGRCLARLFHADGSFVVAAGLVEAELDALEAELGSERLTTIPIDLAQEGAAARLASITDELGLEIDTLVNNAGFGLYGEHLGLDTARVTRMVLLNVLTPTQLATLYGRRMRERRAGRILDVVSTSALQPLPYMAAYAATKHYLLAFGEALAEELAPYGVQVTSLLPGTTRTPFLEVAGVTAEGSRFSVGRLAERVAMSPEDVARAGYEGLRAGARRVIPGRLNRVHAATARLLPEGAMRRAAALVFGAGR